MNGKKSDILNIYLIYDILKINLTSSLKNVILYEDKNRRKNFTNLPVCFDFLKICFKVFQISLIKLSCVQS